MDRHPYRIWYEKEKPPTAGRPPLTEVQVVAAFDRFMQCVESHLRAADPNGHVTRAPMQRKKNGWMVVVRSDLEPPAVNGIVSSCATDNGLRWERMQSAAPIYVP